MQQEIKQWFAGLEDNEQKIVLVFAIVFSLFVLIFGLLKPLNDSINTLQNQLNSRQKSVETWRKAMPILMASKGQNQTSASSLALSSVVTSTSSRFKLRVSRVQEKGSNEMQVWFDNVPFNDFLRWIDDIQSRYQLKVDSVNIRSKDRDGLSSIDVKIIRG